MLAAMLAQVAVAAPPAPPVDRSTWITPGSQQPQPNMNGVNHNPNAQNPNNPNGYQNGIKPGLVVTNIPLTKLQTNGFKPLTNMTPPMWTNGRSGWQPGAGWTNRGSIWTTNQIRR